MEENYFPTYFGNIILRTNSIMKRDDVNNSRKRKKELQQQEF